MGKTTVNRGVYVNGIYYESLSAAGKAIGEPRWRMHRAVQGKIKINGYEVVDAEERMTTETVKEVYIKQQQKTKERKPGSPLLFYPPGENPICRGLPQQWK